jgi:hypothetical protein
VAQVLVGETTASMVLSAVVLGVAEGILFRGMGLALSADAFAGISSLPLSDAANRAATAGMLFNLRVRTEVENHLEGVGFLLLLLFCLLLF